MKSIMQTERECYICAKLGFHTTKNLHEHHFLHGTACRKLADQDGLKGWLCSYHHAQVHDTNSKWDKELQKEAQLRYMEYYEKSVDDFRKRYIRSYL